MSKRFEQQQEKKQQRYKIIDKISDSLYGGVYAATDQQNGRTVALKCFENVQDVGDEFKDDPETEHAAMQALQEAGGHENVVEFLDSYNFEGKFFLVIEYCEHKDAFEIFSSESTEFDVMQSFFELCKGLQFVHSCGIAHLDVSLENILLQNGKLKWTDFGLSMMGCGKAGLSIVAAGKPVYIGTFSFKIHPLDTTNTQCSTNSYYYHTHSPRTGQPSSAKC